MRNKLSILLSLLLATGMAVGGVEYFYSTLEKYLAGDTGEEQAVSTENGKAKRGAGPKGSTAAGAKKTMRAGQQPKDDYAIISKRALFGKVPDTTAPPPPVQETKPAPTPTSMDLILLGTISGSSDEQRAIIRDKRKGKQEIYYRGDAIQNGLIKEIQRGRIILEVNGREEILLMQESKSPKGSASKSKKEKTETYTLADVLEEEEKKAQRRIPPKSTTEKKKTLKIDLNPQEENHDE